MLGMRSGGHREGRLDSGIFDATGGERTGEGGWRGARWGVSGTERGWLTRRSEGLVGIGWYVFNGKGLFDTGQLDRPLRHVPTCDTGQMDRPLRHVLAWRWWVGGRVGGWEEGVAREPVPTGSVDLIFDLHHDADVRTTINISDAILSELRERARQRRRPFREILQETIQLGLSATPPSCEQPVRIETYRVGIKSAYRGLSMNQLYDQIEAEDAGKR